MRAKTKEAFARPLAKALQSRGLKVWFDEFTLTVGDSLRRSIDRGLAHSKFGIVVISPNFLRKNWPQKELDGLVAREVGGVVGAKVILPVWHGIGADEIRAYSPTLADRVAVSSTKGLGHVIAELMRAICPEESTASLQVVNSEAHQGSGIVEIVQRSGKYIIDDAHRQPSSIPSEASAAEYFPSVSAPKPSTPPRPPVGARIPAELRRPRLTVEISKYQPPDRGQMRGDVTFRLRNAGYVEFKVVRVRTQSGNTRNDDLTYSIAVPPGYPTEIVANILPPNGYNPPALRAWFEIETADGVRCRHATEWEVRRSQFVLLKSEIAKE